MSTEIKLENLGVHVQSRPCLVVGSGVTTYISSEEIKNDIARIVGGLADVSVDPDNIPEALDVIGQKNVATVNQCKSAISKYLEELRPSTAAASLARGRWSSIVSLTIDLCLEDEIRKYLDSQPSQWKSTLITSARTITRRSQNLVIYKLLGSYREAAEDTTLALARSELLFRRTLWQSIMRPIRDSVRDGAYLFIGTSGDTELVRDCVSILLSGDPPFPSKLIFLEGDMGSNDPVVSRLAKGRTEICEVKASWKDAVRVIQEAAPFQMRLTLPSGSGARGLASQLEELGHLVSVPPNTSPTYSLSDRRQEILDSLFRPLSVDWAPFQFDLDLRRTQTKQLMVSVDELSSAGGISCIVIRGEAGVGKSTLAKRAALELRKTGQLVLWCRRQSTEASNSFRDLVKLIKKAIASGEIKQPPVIVCDDPYSLRVAVNDVFFPFESEGVSAVFIIIVRNTDYSLMGSGLRLPIIPSREVEVGYELDSDELESLPSFLVAVGAAQKREVAERQVTAIASRNARDILCSFWYLLPETRGVLSVSLEDEYFRLGAESLTERYVSDIGERSLVARRAYEFVAVTSSLDIGLPVEVLVRAVKVGYDEWLNLCSAGKPLWGLLYPDESADGETIVYFTRNEVVTKILLKQINGGIGRAGEFRILRDMIAACDTATPSYREFLIDVLVKRNKTLAERYSDREGRELFELALTTFPVPDRVIVHHYAKWITDVGGDPTNGYQLLQKALNTPEFPLATQEERLELIHTSMAAAVVKRVKRNLQDRDSGLELIKRHLREANTPGFLNLHSVHIQAHALMSLQQGDDRISLECFIEASRSVEKALQLAGRFARGRRRNIRDLEMMEDLKRRMVESLDPFSDLQEPAFASFEKTGEQLVMEAAARKGVLEAGLADKGTDYNKVYQFIRRVALAVNGKKLQLVAGIRRARIDLIVRWRFQHIQGSVDWNEFLGDLLSVQDSPGHRDDALILFYTGIAYFQIGKVNDGLASFARARSVDQSSFLATQVRAYLRDSEGRPKQLQGVVAGPIGRTYMQVPELQTDIPVRQFPVPTGARNGATIAVWVGFSMQGPLAAFRQPVEEDLLLP